MCPVASAPGGPVSKNRRLCQGAPHPTVRHSTLGSAQRPFVLGELTRQQSGRGEVCLRTRRCSMREHRSTSLFMTLVFLMGLAGCVADSAPKGGVPPFTLPPHLSLPGEFLIATALHGNPLFAAYGGGSVNDAINTAGSGVSAYTKYRLWSAGPQAPQYKFIETANGYSVMAFNGGGLATSNAIVTDLKGLPAGPNSAWGMFRFGRMGPNGVAITIQTSNGNFVTAVGGGGQLTNALHTDATTAKSWEQFTVTKCGDLGSGFTYALLATGSGLLSASGGGGRTQGAIVTGGADDSARFTLIRQADGTYALRTSNGINYVTAVGEAAAPTIILSIRMPRRYKPGRNSEFLTRVTVHTPSRPPTAASLVEEVQASPQT